MRFQCKRVAVAAALTAGSVMAISAPGAPVLAAVFAVNSTLDGSDASPGDGNCDTGSGTCTLRAAVEESNANGVDDDITLPAGTYQLGSGLDITNGVIDIDGAGSATTIIDGAGSTRLFLVDGGGLTVRDVTLTGGGGAQVGGAIYLDTGGLQIEDSLIIDNEAFTGGGAIFINEDQSFDIRRTTFDNNNATGAFGGALWNVGDGKVLDSTFVDNESNRAGAIHNNDVGQLRLRNVTVSGNVARSDTGGTGGVHNNGFLVLNNVTITDNAGYDRAGGILSTSGATTVMKNSIVAGNDDTSSSSGNEDCGGDFTSDSRYNLIGETSAGCGLPALTTSWLLDIDPMLSPLANNGGPTRTHSIPSNSPARDAGYPFPPGGPAADSCEADDQRGIQRLKCDMGAYEYEVAVPAVLTVFVDEDGVDVSPGDGSCAAASGFCTLRAAVQESNWLPGTQTIDLSGNTYQLTIPAGDESGFDPAAVGDLDLRDDVIIDGFIAEPDIVTIDAQDNYRVFDVSPGTSASLRGLTVTGGTDSSGGGIRVSSGQLDLQHVRVIGNTSSSSGGGISTGGLDEVLTISDSWIGNNTAPFFGGRGAGISSGGTLTITDSRISGNVGSGSGGGVFASNATLTRVLVADNRANGGSASGGGISSSNMTVTESLFVNNLAGTHGGGIFGSGLVTNTTVYGNSAGTRGGGVSTNNDLTVRGVTIAENSADDNGNSTLVFGSGAELHLDNTILTSTAPGDECDGLAPTSLGHNLAGDATCNLTGPGDLPTTASGLGPLADNGGPTHTAAPLAGSAAIDAGSDVGLTIDQRGQARPAAAGFDIGAVEGTGGSGTSDNQMLFVGGTAGPLTTDAQYVNRFTSWGYDVTLIDDDVVAAGAEAGFDVVFISSTVVPNKVGAAFTAATVPVVVAELYLTDDLGMTDGGSSVRREQAGIGAVKIADPSHPITAGLSGYLAYSLGANKIGWARPAPSAQNLVTAGGGSKSALFVYETGDSMHSGVAPARRAFVYPTAAMPLTATTATWTLIEQTVAWATATT